MSRFFPHTAYAEDQPLAHTILWTHVLTRGVTLGSLIGTGVGASILGLRTFGILKSAAKLSPASFILRSSGNGVLVSARSASTMLRYEVVERYERQFGRMRKGRDSIGWEVIWTYADRRLCTDRNWTYGSCRPRPHV
jgi:hypothetical protein